MCGCIIDPMSVLTDQFGRPVNLSLDAFQRLRTSQPATIFCSKQIYDNQSLYFATLTSGGAGATITYNNARASSSLAVAANGERAVRQTRRYFNYIPGKSTQTFESFRFESGGQVGVTKRVGYFDDNNGIYLEMNGATLGICVRSNVSGVVVNNLITQANWNVDQMNGTGPGGITLNPAAIQIFAFDFEWLGAGSVRIGFVVGDIFIPVHRFNHANLITSVYMQTPNLPIRYEILSTGGAGALEAICTTIVSESGNDPVGTSRSVSTPSARSLAAGLYQQLISIRTKSGVYLNTPIIPLGTSVMCSTTGQGLWQVISNPTLAGAAVWVPVSNSAIEYDVTRTTVTPGSGTVISSGFFSSDTSQTSALLREALNLGADVAGTTRDELCLAVTNTGTTPDSYYGSMDWIQPQ